MAKRELRRKIIATILTVTLLLGLIGGGAWLLMGDSVVLNSDTLRLLMLICVAVLVIATLGLLVAKIQEIRALRRLIRDEEERAVPAEDSVPHTDLKPLQTLDHTTIELPALTDIPLADESVPAPEKPAPSRSVFGARGSMDRPAAEAMAQADAIEVIPPKPVAVQEEAPRWKPIDFNAALKARQQQENEARRRAAEEAYRAQQAKLAEQARLAEEKRLAEEAARAEKARLEEEALRAEEERLAEKAAEVLAQAEAQQSGGDHAEPAPSVPEAAEEERTEAFAEPEASEPDNPVFETIIEHRSVPETAQTPEQTAVLAAEPDETPAAEPVETPEAEPEIPAEECDGIPQAAPVSAAHLQAIRQVQEARRSAQSRAAEESELDGIARRAETQRLSVQQPEPASAPESGPLPAEMWENTQPICFDFSDSAPAAPAPESAPAAPAAEEWVAAAPRVTLPDDSGDPEDAENEPEVTVVHKKRGFFASLFHRKKPEPDPEIPDVPEFVPAPEPEPAPEPAPAAEPQQPAKLNVKPIAWPAPPPPSRNFVHPPQSTMQFSAIRPEQIAQMQREAQPRSAAASAQKPASEQAAKQNISAKYWED